jgi:hypothetical protein
MRSDAAACVGSLVGDAALNSPPTTMSLTVSRHPGLNLAQSAEREDDRRLHLDASTPRDDQRSWRPSSGS